MSIKRYKNEERKKPILLNGGSAIIDISFKELASNSKICTKCLNEWTRIITQGSSKREIYLNMNTYSQNNASFSKYYCQSCKVFSVGAEGKWVPRFGVYFGMKFNI